jgi:hypothetical protein
MTRDLQGVMGAANTAGSNVAASKVIGDKRKETEFSASFVGDSVSFVQSRVRKTLDIQGAVVGKG